MVGDGRVHLRSGFSKRKRRKKRGKEEEEEEEKKRERGGGDKEEEERERTRETTGKRNRGGYLLPGSSLPSREGCCQWDRAQFCQSNMADKTSAEREMRGR